MVAYHFYFNDGVEEPSLIGILPERRKNHLRITRESIMKWGFLAAGSHIDPAKINFIAMELENEADGAGKRS